MARRINCRINVKALDKKKLFVGEKGTYANITLIETPGGKHGDWMIVENKDKDAPRDVKSTILGNGKNYGWGTSGGSTNTNISVNDLPI